MKTSVQNGAMSEMLLPTCRGGTSPMLAIATLWAYLTPKPPQGPALPEGQSSAGMGDIVNLRRARKHADRQAADRKAATNRLLHGRSKAERELETLRTAKAQRELDRHRIVTEDER